MEKRDLGKNKIEKILLPGWTDMQQMSCVSVYVQIMPGVSGTATDRSMVLWRIMGLLKTCIGSHQEGFQDPNKMFHFLYMGMPGLTTDTQRAELIGRVGVIPYRNDRQEQIKRECWWTWWYRWLTLWWGGKIQNKGGTWGWVKILFVVEYGLELWAEGRFRYCFASISHHKDNYNQDELYYLS